MRLVIKMDGYQFRVAGTAKARPDHKDKTRQATTRDGEPIWTVRLDAIDAGRETRETIWVEVAGDEPKLTFEGYAQVHGLASTVTTMRPPSCSTPTPGTCGAGSPPTCRATWRGSRGSRRKSCAPCCVSAMSRSRNTRHAALSTSTPSSAWTHPARTTSPHRPGTPLRCCATLSARPPAPPPSSLVRPSGSASARRPTPGPSATAATCPAPARRYPGRRWPITSPSTRPRP